MALHRDIYWVGRQWAVTGYGMQACNQKQKGQFDIEVEPGCGTTMCVESLRANAGSTSRISRKRCPSRGSAFRSRLER